MRSWRSRGWLLMAWTLMMGAWLALYQHRDATCGPEIERDCSIGLSVTAGLGRPGVVLLWALGVAAFGVAWLTDRHRTSRTPRRPQKRGRRALGDAALVAVVAAPLVLVLPTSTRPTREGSVPAASAVNVRVISAILHPSASSAGRQRHAARVSVHVHLNNLGRRRVTLRPPKLLSGRTALTYDQRQFALEPLDPGAVVDATLRFEPRSAFTQRLVSERDAQLQIAGRTIPLTLKIGAPVRKSRLRGRAARRDARRVVTRPPPRAAPAPATPARRPPRRATRARPAPLAPAPSPRATPPPPPPQRLPDSTNQRPRQPSFDDSG